MIQTNSLFYYGFDVTEDNFYIDFDEGGGELTAEIELGSYTATTFCEAVKTAMDIAGSLTYTVSFNRSTRAITISAGSNFSILKTTGTHNGAAPWTLMGFTQAGNLTSASTYTGASAAGYAYTPQFKLQDYVSKDDLQEAVDATVNETASGKVEVVKFGTRQFYEFNIMYATDIPQTTGVITNNASGVANLRQFMQFLVTKAPCEFMPDATDTATFDNVILESTEQSSKGVGYKLRELYDKNLPGYYQTGKLRFRVVEL